MRIFLKWVLFTSLAIALSVVVTFCVWAFLVSANLKARLDRAESVATHSPQALFDECRALVAAAPSFSPNEAIPESKWGSVIKSIEPIYVFVNRDAVYISIAGGHEQTVCLEYFSTGSPGRSSGRDLGHDELWF